MKSQSMRYLAAAGCVLGLAVLVTSCAQSKGSAARPAAAESMGVSPLLSGVDLTVTSVSAPGSASLGSTISVVHVTKNVGTSSAIAPQNKFYLCTGSTAAAGCYRNMQNLSLIGPGVSVTRTNSSLIIPTNATVGVNHIIVVTGFGVADVNVANNTNSTQTINIQ